MSLPELRDNLRLYLKLNSLGATYQWIVDRYFDTRMIGADLDSDGDMLLFQWGIYDWGKGIHSSVDLTRQIIITEDDEDAIFQLRCTYRFPQSLLINIKPGNVWCASPSDIGDFTEVMFSNPAYIAALKDAPLDAECDVCEQ